MTDNLFDIIIVGGASAGLTAAVYASRQNVKTLVLTKDIGGQAILTDHIENYPGRENVCFNVRTSNSEYDTCASFSKPQERQRICNDEQGNTIVTYHRKP